MKKETLNLIHDEAMVCVSFIRDFGWNRKYEWKFWGYLEALYDLDAIDLDEYIKIKKHYRKYFGALRMYFMA